MTLSARVSLFPKILGVVVFQRNGLTHEDVDELARQSPVFGHEERELVIVGQLHGLRQVGERDVTHGDGTAGVISETVGDGAG